MRSTVAHLSTENLLHNLKIIKQTAPNSKVIGMVKANAYGHGLRSIAKRLQNSIDFLGVAAIDEALQLRKAGVTTPVVLMEGVFEPEEVIIAASENFSIVFHNQQQLDWLNECSANFLIKQPINAWIKIDTGMSRLGFDLLDAKNAYQNLLTNTHIVNPVGVMSHFACADNKSHPLNFQQIKNFNNLLQSLKNVKNINTKDKSIKDSFIKSFCNSAAIFNFSSEHYDVVRPGLALYGVSPILNQSARDLNLKPVMTLQTKIIAIKNLLKDSFVGYGARFRCHRDMTVAVIAIGYGDGYPRTAIDGTPVIINKKLCQIIGAVSMDMAVVDLANCNDAKIGDPVILWGDDLPIEEIAGFTQNSVYDLLTAVQNRVKFIWS